MSKETSAYADDLQILEQMFAAGFDVEEWYESHVDAPEEVFRRVFVWYDYRKGDRTVVTANFGGHEFADTPRSLYRAFYLFEPEVADLSDMYKTGTLVDFCSPCGQFTCSFQLHKYAACVRFYCAQEYIEGTPTLCQGGWADCDNGLRCSSEFGMRWFHLAVKALEREWDVYPGNNFVV
jgi:hypothetical protein